MPHNPLRRPPLMDLPVESLHELLVTAVQNLLDAMESDHPDEGTVKAKKKEVEIIHNAIMAKKEEKAG